MIYKCSPFTISHPQFVPLFVLPSLCPSLPSLPILLSVSLSFTLSLATPPLSPPHLFSLSVSLPLSVYLALRSLSPGDAIHNSPAVFLGGGSRGGGQPPPSPTEKEGVGQRRASQASIDSEMFSESQLASSISNSELAGIGGGGGGAFHHCTQRHVTLLRFPPPKLSP